MDVVNAMPLSWLEKLTLANSFYDGLSLSIKQLLEFMCNGGFLHKPNNEALEFLSSIVELTRGWEESIAKRRPNLG